MKTTGLILLQDDKTGILYIVKKEDIKRIRLSETYDLLGKKVGNRYGEVYGNADDEECNSITYTDKNGITRTLIVHEFGFGTGDLTSWRGNYHDEYTEQEYLALFSYALEKKEWKDLGFGKECTNCYPRIFMPSYPTFFVAALGSRPINPDEEIKIGDVVFSPYKGISGKGDPGFFVAKKMIEYKRRIFVETEADDYEIDSLEKVPGINDINNIAIRTYLCDKKTGELKLLNESESYKKTLTSLSDEKRPTVITANNITLKCNNFGRKMFFHKYENVSRYVKL